MIPPRQSRTIRVRQLEIGGRAPIAVQSMAATRTQDVEATVRQVELLERAGADLVRIAVDSKADVEALKTVRSRTQALLSVDLQENYRLAELVAPFVDKLRYNPGHLHHHEKTKPVEDKVAYLVGVAREHDGQAMMLRPWKKFGGTERKRPASTSARIARPTSISMPLSSNGTVSETRSVSPMPRARSCSKAMRVLITPSGGKPASVTPRCSGTSGRSSAKRTFVSTTWRGSESLIETQ